MNYLTFLLIVLVTHACTIEKRVHNRGWHVEWNARNHSRTAENSEPAAASIRDASEELAAEPKAYQTDTVISSATESSVDQVENTGVTAVSTDAVEVSSEPGLAVGSQTVSNREDPTEEPEVRKHSFWRAFLLTLTILLFIYAMALIFGLIAATFSIAAFANGVGVGAILVATIGGYFLSALFLFILFKIFRTKKDPWRLALIWAIPAIVIMEGVILIFELYAD